MHNNFEIKVIAKEKIPQQASFTATLLNGRILGISPAHTMIYRTDRRNNEKEAVLDKWGKLAYKNYNIAANFAQDTRIS